MGKPRTVASLPSRRARAIGARRILYHTKTERKRRTKGEKDTRTVKKKGELG